MKKYRLGIIIGRWQPFHKGHLYLLRKSLEYADQLIVGVGSIGVSDENNFLDYEKRKSILQEVIEKEDLTDKVIKIVPLVDFHNDKKWLDNIFQQAGKVDVVIGNNEWTNGIFERAGIPAIRIPYLKRNVYEGKKIRELMKKRQKWEDRVPEYTVSIIK